MALQVVDGAAHLHRPAVADVSGMHQVGAAGEDVGLQRDAEPAAIVDHVNVVMRDAAGPGIEPQALLEAALLQRSIDLGEGIAAPQGQAATAQPPRGFEDDAIVAGAIEFIGGAQARHAGTQDGDALARSGIRRKSEAGRERRRGFEEIPRGQGLIHRPRASQARHRAQHGSSRHRHGPLPSLIVSAAYSSERDGGAKMFHAEPVPPTPLLRCLQVGPRLVG